MILYEGGVSLGLGSLVQGNYRRLRYTTRTYIYVNPYNTP